MRTYIRLKLILALFLCAPAAATTAPITTPMPEISDLSARYALDAGFITNVKVGFLRDRKVTVLSILPVGNGASDEKEILFCDDVASRFDAFEGWQAIIVIYPHASASRSTACHELSGITLDRE